MRKVIKPIATKLGFPEIHWHALRHWKNLTTNTPWQQYRCCQDAGRRCPCCLPTSVMPTAAIRLDTSVHVRH
jgi:hypothetical protein